MPAETAAPPAPPAPPPSKPAFGVGPNLNNAFDALDKMAKPPSTEGAVVPPHPAQKKAEPPPKKDETATPPKKEDAPPDDKSKEAPKDTPKETEEDDDLIQSKDAPKGKEEAKATPPVDGDKPKKPADFLREKLATVEKERDTFRQEAEKLKTDHPDVKALSEKLEAESKARKTLEDEIRFVNYEKSPEYEQKYKQPFLDAYAQGRSKAAALKVIDSATGDARPGTPADFDAIMGIRDDEAAAEMIEQLFGTGSKAQMITLHREKVIELNAVRQKAVDEFRTKGSELAKAHMETMGKLTKEAHTLWEKFTAPQSIPEKHRQYILPKDGDEPGNKLLAKGYELFDKVTADNARDPHHTPEERAEIVARAATIRHRAAAYGRLTRWIEERDARIAELEKENAEYKASEPKGGDGGSRSDAHDPAPDSMAGVLAALDRKARPAG